MKVNNNELSDLLWQTLYAAGIAVEVKPEMTVYSITAWGVESHKLHHLELVAIAYGLMMITESL